MASKSSKTPVKGKYYAELDEDMDLYCVFNEETGDFAFSSWSSMEDAQEDTTSRMRILSNRVGYRIGVNLEQCRSPSQLREPTEQL